MNNERIGLQARKHIMRQNGETVESDSEEAKAAEGAVAEDAANALASPELDELQQQLMAMSSAQYVQVAPGVIAPAGLQLQTGAPVMLAPSSQAVALAQAQQVQALQQQQQLVRASVAAIASSCAIARQMVSRHLLFCFRRRTSKQLSKPRRRKFFCRTSRHSLSHRDKSSCRNRRPLSCARRRVWFVCPCSRRCWQERSCSRCSCSVSRCWPRSRTLS